MTRETKTAACWAKPVRVRPVDGSPAETWGVSIPVEDAACAVKGLVVMVRTRNGRTFPRRLVKELYEDRWQTVWLAEAPGVGTENRWASPESSPSRTRDRETEKQEPLRPQPPRPIGCGTGPVAEAVAQARDAGIPDSEITQMRNRCRSDDEFVRELRLISGSD